MTEPLTTALPVLHAGLEQIRLAGKNTDTDPRIDEVKGLLYFWVWSLSADQSDARAYRDSAAYTLEQTVNTGKQSARSWAALSTIYTNTGNFMQAQYSAERALRADMYARDVSATRLRLFQSALENRDTSSARAACDDIARTMGASWWGSYCEVAIIAWNTTATPNEMKIVERALAQTASLGMPQQDFLKAAAGVAFANGGEIARAHELYDGLSTSGQLGDEILPERAWLATAMHDAVRARADLQAYVAARPAARSGVLKSRRFQN
ncbi:MAG TPA: hypothetical protein VF035_02805 [Longimicrobiales bacterium]